MTGQGRRCSGCSCRAAAGHPAIGEDEYERLVELGGLAEMRAAVAAELAALPAPQRRAVRTDEAGARP
jgi:hypothetical protein